MKKQKTTTIILTERQIADLLSAMDSVENGFDQYTDHLSFSATQYLKRLQVIETKLIKVRGEMQNDKVST